MKILHEKTHSCRRFAWRYGAKRRRCSICGKTWTVWPKKRGRKHSRPDKSLLKKVFVERQRLKQTAAVRLKRISLSAASQRFQKALISNNHSPDRLTFRGLFYILVIDALWHCFNGQRWTLYLGAARNISGTRAKLLPPFLVQGKESLTGWRLFIDTLPQSLKKRLKAVISDGWRGVDTLAKENRWLLQRCHFHFLAQLKINRGKWKCLPNQTLREAIRQNAIKLLSTKNRVNFYKERLLFLISQPKCPNRLKIIIRDYLRHLKYFRSCLNHPKLNLPNTTNSMESINNLIREQCRYLNNPSSLARWSKSFIKIKGQVACNKAKSYTELT